MQAACPARAVPVRSAAPAETPSRTVRHPGDHSRYPLCGACAVIRQRPSVCFRPPPAGMMVWRQRRGYAHLPGTRFRLPQHPPRPLCILPAAVFKLPYLFLPVLAEVMQRAFYLGVPAPPAPERPPPVTVATTHPATVAQSECLASVAVQRPLTNL